MTNTVCLEHDTAVLFGNARQQRTKDIMTNKHSMSGTRHGRDNKQQTWWLTWYIWKMTQRYSPTPDSGSWKSQTKSSTSPRCWYCVRFSVPMSIISGGVWSTCTPSVDLVTLPPALVWQREISHASGNVNQIRRLKYKIFLWNCKQSYRTSTRIFLLLKTTTTMLLLIAIQCETKVGLNKNRVYFPHCWKCHKFRNLPPVHSL